MMRKIWYLYVREVALFISDMAEWAWEKGGNLECWVDTKLAGE